MASQTGYVEFVYKPPFKGIDVSLPETEIDGSGTPNALNWIVRGGELRSRPRSSVILPGLPDKSQPTGINAFMDANNVVHTIVVSTTGLWQLNPGWRNNRPFTWNRVGTFPNNSFPASTTYVQFQNFLTQTYFVNGGSFLWNWDGITPTGVGGSIALKSIAIYDTVNGLSAGGLFLGELDSRLILLNTIEQVQPIPGPTKAKFPSNFQQRIRWSASGLPTTWDPTVNIGAGFNDELDVPDAISGFLTIGRNGFIFRVNGISEMTSISSGPLPFDFNHLWASDRGIGSVFPFSIAGYGPIGIFIASDDIYNLSLGGFKKVGGKARNAIYNDLANAIASPVASMFPTFTSAYPYLTYMLSIPLAGNVAKNWCYFVEDDCWMPWNESNGFMTGRMRAVPTI